jgi:eukaryotic-like serine/threonine-protein kinase
MVSVATGAMLGDRYRLIERIASGGMATVWEAEDTALHRRVAVKVMSARLSDDESFLERFRREARAAARLLHPNAAAIFDYGEDSGTPYIVMELLRGSTLADRLRLGPLDPAEAVDIVEQVGAALEAAHQAGIVHRDVKPGNIMLTATGAVKVMDFGIAAAQWAASITGTGATMGTPTYLSPEQASGGSVSPASDVYALGVVLYEMLAGRPPFQGGSPVAVAAAHVNQAPPPLDRVAPHVPATLASATAGALAKDPHRRPASAAAFVRTVREAVVGEGGSEVTQQLHPPERTAVLPAVDATPGRDDSQEHRTEAPKPSPRVAHRGLRPLAVLAIVVGLGGAVLAGSLWLLASIGGRDGRAAQATVPNVEGRSVEDATARIEEAGLSVGGTEEVQGPEGKVVRTDPQGGAVLRIGSPVTLYVGGPPAEQPAESPPPDDNGRGDDDNGGDNGKGKGQGKGGGKGKGKGQD